MLQDSLSSILINITVEDPQAVVDHYDVHRSI